MTEAERQAAEERAEKRRATWIGGVARGFKELDDLDFAGWQGLTGAERMLAIWPLTLDALAFAGHEGPPPRLQRSVGGIRRRER